MERKTEESLVNRSLGFEVEVEQAPMRRMRGEWVLDIGTQRFQHIVLWKLIVSLNPLSGDHVRFMRLALEQTMEAFASYLEVSAPAVSKWQKKEERPTQMNKGTEVLMRLFAAESLLNQAELSETTRDSIFYHVFEKISQFDGEGEPESIRVTRDELRRAENNAADLPLDFDESGQVRSVV